MLGRSLCFGMVLADDGPKVGRSGRRLKRGCALKVTACGLIQAYGEIIFGEPRQPLRKMVDGIVLYRARAMAAVALYFQAKIDIVFLAGLHAEQKALAFLGFKVAGIGVDAVFGVDPFAMVLDEPLYAVGLAAFFVRRESDDQIAGRNPAFFFEADEVGDQNRVTLLDVGGAAAIEE